MRDAALIKRLCVAALGVALMILLAGCSVEAGDGQAAHDLVEKFAKEAGEDKAEQPKLAGDAQRKADEAVRPAAKDHRKTEEAARQVTEERRKAEEAEMLARARAEAEQRRAEIMKAREEAERAERERKGEQERRLAETRRKAEEERRVAETRKAEEQARAAEEERWLAEARRKAEQEVKAEEARRDAEEAARRAAEERRIAEARAAEEARRKAEDEARAEEARRLAEAARRAEEERRLAETRKVEEERRLAEAKRLAEEQVRVAEAAEDARRANLQAEREAEAQRLAEKLRQAREERANRTAAAERREQAGPSLPLASEQGSAEPTEDVRAVAGARLGGPHSPPYAERVDRVTVLLVLEPGNYGIRRHNKTGDPILCSLQGCYVSNGADEAASFLSGHRALRFGRIFGERAGACSNSLSCVFRDIDLRSIAQFVAPIDMHVLKHDRRQPQQNVAVSDCGVEGAHLRCRGGIRTADYMMWIVPEALAERVGPEALEDALTEGLSEHKRVGLVPSSMR